MQVPTILNANPSFVSYKSEFFLMQTRATLAASLQAGAILGASCQAEATLDGSPSFP